jgi:hypothetical protein
MLKPVIRVNEESGEKQLFMVPESDLEERFVLWFAFENSIPRQRVNNKESLVFHHMSDPDMAQQSLLRAFENFKKRFNYMEIPYLIGVTLQRAREELHFRGLHWAIEREVETDEYPPGTVVGQNPLSEAVAAPQSVVYLSISKAKE